MKFNAIKSTKKKTVKIYNVMAFALCPSNVFELFIGHT